MTMIDMYASLLASANSNYQATLSGYQSALNAQIQEENRVVAGYNSLYKNVLGGIQGVEKSASQNIADVYSQQVGQQTQSLVDRGLGNSTVTSGVMRGLTLDEQKAQTALQNQFAQLQAGYQSQLGLAGLGYQGQAIQQNTALLGKQLDYMGAYGMQQNQLALGYAGLANQRAMASMGRGGGGGGGFGGGSSRSPLSGLGQGFGSYGAALSGSNAPWGSPYGGSMGVPSSGMWGGGGYGGGSETLPAPSPYVDFGGAGDWGGGE